MGTHKSHLPLMENSKMKEYSNICVFFYCGYHKTTRLIYFLKIEGAQCTEILHFKIKGSSTLISLTNPICPVD